MGATTIVRPGESAPAMMLQWHLDPLDPARKSPKKFGIDQQPWEFPWVTLGYGQLPAEKSVHMRFRVYAQEHKTSETLSPKVAQMLMTLWGECLHRMNYDHADLYNGSIVDVFLCIAGRPGGEQRFDITVEGGREKRVNTMYFYDLSSFTDPVEMAREVAHEYGHAELPAIGGYTAPENWANGILGERLFLNWMTQGLEQGRYGPADAMGSTAADLRKWVTGHVDPLVLKASATLPTQAWLKNSSAEGMDRYTGLAVYASMVLPDMVFGRSMRLTGSTDAWDYPDALVLATDEPDEYELRIPKLLANRPIWVPTGKGKISGAKILKFEGQWAQIQASEGVVKVVNRASSRLN
jgi:hypothetical protein